MSDILTTHASRDVERLLDATPAALPDYCEQQSRFAIVDAEMSEAVQDWMLGDPEERTPLQVLFASCILQKLDISADILLRRVQTVRDVREFCAALARFISDCVPGLAKEFEPPVTPPNCLVTARLYRWRAKAFDQVHSQYVASTEAEPEQDLSATRELIQ